MSLGSRLAQLPRPLIRQLVPILRYFNLMRALERRWMAPWVRQVEGKCVLDTGCGHGLYSVDLACRGAVLTGCDVQADVLAQAREIADQLGLQDRTLFLLADGTSLPCPTGQFDLAICNCVLEHIPDDQAALSALARVLRPGGILYLTVDGGEHSWTLGFLERLPARVVAWLLKPQVVAGPDPSRGLDAYLDETYSIHHRFRRDELAARLTDLGFEILDCRTYLSGIGAAQFELLHALRGLDPGRGLGRLLYSLSSIVLYPLAVRSDKRQRRTGRGLAIAARRTGDPAPS